MNSPILRTWSDAESTGLGSVCFVVINACVLSANRVDFLFHKLSNFDRAVVGGTLQRLAWACFCCCIFVIWLLSSCLLCLLLLVFCLFGVSDYSVRDSTFTPIPLRFTANQPPETQVQKVLPPQRSSLMTQIARSSLTLMWGEFFDTNVFMGLGGMMWCYIQDHYILHHIQCKYRYNTCKHKP
mgnify:CR=1 FL=1